MSDLISRQAAIDAIKKSRFLVDAMEKVIKLPSAQPEWKIYKERYDDLCEYFNNNPETIKAILWDRKEFKAWLERAKWHVLECDKLARELEKIIHCKDCKYCEHWCDKGKCFLWVKDGIDVFEDGFCNYGERKGEGEQDG